MLLDILKQWYRYLEIRRMSMNNITGDPGRLNGYLIRYLTDLILLEICMTPQNPKRYL
jgi:hypothetical protein